jgi:hypothetical protein
MSAHAALITSLAAALSGSAAIAGMRAFRQDLQKAEHQLQELRPVPQISDGAWFRRLRDRQLEPRDTLVRLTHNLVGAYRDYVARTQCVERRVRAALPPEYPGIVHQTMDDGGGPPESRASPGREVAKRPCAHRQPLVLLDGIYHFAPFGLGAHQIQWLTQYNQTSVYLPIGPFRPSDLLAIRANDLKQQSHWLDGGARVCRIDLRWVEAHQHDAWLPLALRALVSAATAAPVATMLLFPASRDIYTAFTNHWVGAGGTVQMVSITALRSALAGGTATAEAALAANSLTTTERQLLQRWLREERDRLAADPHDWGGNLHVPPGAAFNGWDL